MPRLRKPLILAGACALALLLALRGPAPGLRAQPSFAPRAAAYDLAQLPILTKALFQVNETYFDKTRFNQRRMLLGALDAVQRDVPEILVDRLPEPLPRKVRVRVGNSEQVFDLEGVDSPWRLRSTLQQIFRFVQPRLDPRPAPEEGRRLEAIEIAATNGILSTLDPHSVLMDADSYREMRTTTQGRFGGVGMGLIEDRRRGIVVRHLIPDTPAVRAGILARDRIVRIDGESTINMTVMDAVDRLRGEVGAPVDIYIERAGTPGSRKLTVVRDMIHPSSIERARVLTSRAGPGQPPARIGYLRIDHFSASTETDLLATLDRFEREKVRGLIVDLRGNPGGLYEQAAKVADAFIGSGVLVSMVGVGGAQRRDEVATAGGNLKLPLALLVDGRSASASEIVAGAVKNLDRGLVIGDTTFGKGSVQNLFDLPGPGAAATRGAEEPRLGLKLTTAQYLTPGDASIQGLGVSPDVELVPMRVEKAGAATVIHLQKSAHRRQESDLQASLEQAGARKPSPPAESIAYLHVPGPGEPRFQDEADGGPGEDADADADPEDGADGDEDAAAIDVDAIESHVDFAMELARDLLAQTRATSRRQMLAGAAAFFARVRAEQDDEVQGAIGKLGVDWRPGERGPAAPGKDPAILKASLAVVGSARPVPAGETVRLRGAVKNTGATPAHRVRVVLASPNLLFDENEMVFGRLAPQESRSFELAVKIPRGSLTRTDVIQARVLAETPVQATPAETTLDIQGKPRPLFAYSYRTVGDGGSRDGRVQRGEKVRLLVTIKNLGAGPALRTEAVLRNGAGQPGILITAGRFRGQALAPGATRDLAFAYQVGPDFRADSYQLELTVADPLLGEGVTDKLTVRLAPAAAQPPATGSVTPPVLTVDAPTATAGNTVRVTGRALDDHQVRDLYIRVYNRDSKQPLRKVFYLPNRGDPRALAFEAEVPVLPGSNLIQICARETDQVTAVSNLVVLQKQDYRLVQAR